MPKQRTPGFSITHWRFATALLGYLLRGRLHLAGGHLPPPAGHTVPTGFAGVGVAPAANPAVDDYLLARLDDLGLRHIRLDFSYGDASGPAGRLLERLLVAGYRVLLHLVQPAQAARDMHTEAAQNEWRTFVADTLDRYGTRIEAIEVGSTINRKRWAGYDLDGFFTAWEIAHAAVRARGIVLAGPNVTDFEPPFNIGWLALLRQKNQLPDIHTNNLFSERCTEPERDDHKVFGRLLAPLFRINLIHKARLLQRIGADFSVPRLWSPAAFWTLPRIERMLPAIEEKQADYLARYLLLCAASGALERAWWGPLLCHREGLIDDGEAPYPKLERVTHYATVADDIGRFRIRPAFHALRAFNALIPGGRYAGKLATGRALEAHAFLGRGGEYVHAIWTINGRVAALADLYAPDDLHAACCQTRDGVALATPPDLIGETPLYLVWPAGRVVSVLPGADVLKDVVIDWHAPGQSHFLFCENGWRGILRASDADTAKKLLTTIHPEHVAAPTRDTSLRHARNAIWTVDDPRTPGARLVVKQPVKMHWHKRLLDRFKPAKGLRSWNGTCQLLRHGIAAAPPVAWFEQIGDPTLMRNHYVCAHVAADCTVRELFVAYAGGAPTHLGIERGEAFRRLVDYLLTLHGRGIFFRDLSGGNILVRIQAGGIPEFVLIDTGRIRVYPRALTLGQRLSDLVRICHKLDWTNRKDFMCLYLGWLGYRFGWRQRLPFVLYDLKVALKRSAALKWLKRRSQ